ncbi:hypothetical protein KP509_29G016400 [Ceratopteris richardii]|uniref:Uncharacterized protein n=1 Tax=Ceratopteris richardii TaxID=49495 RepID=A0A8T2R4X3_CERRI|nr:hypothetical protein KP509_29G016400 [Ceratopteris richardii]
MKESIQKRRPNSLKSGSSLFQQRRSFMVLCGPHRHAPLPLLWRRITSRKMQELLSNRSKKCFHVPALESTCSISSCGHAVYSNSFSKKYCFCRRIIYSCTENDPILSLS